MFAAKIPLLLKVIAFISSFFLLAVISPVQAGHHGLSNIEAGKKIAFHKKKGNCLACHQIENGVTKANIGPPLIGMKLRFPKKAKLRKQIWDATEFNKETPMPPFGRHKILTESEIDKVVEYIWSL